MVDIAVLRFVRVALTHLETGRSWVVLNNQVVPVCNPEGTVGPHFRLDRCKPVVQAGKKIELISRPIGRTCLIEIKLAQKSSGRFADEPLLGRILFWKISGRSEERRVGRGVEGRDRGA